jgi:hypothetical protein
MLFPVQSMEGLGGRPAGSTASRQVDAELAFTLAVRAAGVTWILPEEMRRALAASPGLEAPLEGLPVGMFSQAEVRRVGDPLFGYLRRMAALVDCDIALLPVFARYRAPSAARASAIEVGAALISARSGQVLWFGVVEGDPGPADDPGSLASAVEALARRLLPTPRD